MYLEVAERLKQALRGAVHDRYGVELTQIAAEAPPRPALGDIAFPVALGLAKQGHGKPREIAAALVSTLAAVPGVRKVDVAGAGYLNVYLERGRYALQLLAEVAADRRPNLSRGPGKTIIEHTNINPNKAAHIGHVRNAVLGDTLARVLRYAGEEVEVQNYIDDTGVQVADVVVGFEDIEKKSLAEVEAIPEPFDHHCWDLYAQVGRYYAEDATRKARRSAVLRAVEEGGNPTAALAAHIAQRVVRRHLATIGHLGVAYDLLAWEGDILRLALWRHAFAKLKETGAIHLASEGPNTGCWVMRLTESERFKELEDPDKVIVRSDGTATYVAKDIAYQMWKFGLLGVDFRYRHLDAEGPWAKLWTTTSEPGETPPAPFGRAARGVNVIDVRQSYLQNIVAEGLRALGATAEAEASVHFSYEMVALTPACCAELGIELSEEDRRRPYVEMSGRKGLGIKADDLVGTMVRLAAAEVKERHADLTSEDIDRLAREIAVGGLRYFMLRFGRTKVVAFDFKEALNFRGETGAYLQNAVVRARSIFRKLKEKEGVDWAEARAFRAEDLTDMGELDADDEFWELVLGLSKLDEALANAIANLELAILAKYAFVLAQRFHRFYDHYRVVGEPDGPAKRLRAAAIALYLARMSTVLSLMGIPVPARM